MIDLSWSESGVPISTRFDDPYYSLEDGLAEARHVFLDGNDLPARFRPGFAIAELGFGTGLNMLAAWMAWQASGAAGVMSFTSFEAFPLTPADLARALSRFPAVAEPAQALIAAYRLDAVIALPGLEARIITGDANKTVTRWDGTADAWFLDGFSPARNPELWRPALMAAVASHTRPGGSFATYSAAGPVRRALEQAGFRVERQPGYGRKRHMTAGVLPDASAPDRPLSATHAG